MPARAPLTSLAVLAAAACAVLLSSASAAAEHDDQPLQVVQARFTPAAPPLRPVGTWSAPSRPRVALALSGGGARGLAHAGVLMALEEAGLEWDAIAGTSAGALVGALSAAGYSGEEIVDLLRTRDWNQLLQQGDLRRRVLSRQEDLARSSAQVRVRRRRGDAADQPGGLYSTQRIERELQVWLLSAQAAAGAEFDALRHRFRPVTTDLVTGDKVTPARGDLASLVRASSSVPGVQAPLPSGDALLVDGGLRENVPVETARELEADVVVAVDVSQRLEGAVALEGVLSVLDRSLDIMMDAKTRESLALADVVLEPDVDALPRIDFSRNLDALVAAGRAAVRDALPELLAAMDDRAEASPTLRYDRLVVRGAESLVTEPLVPASGEVARWRVEALLARALNADGFASARAELRPTDGDGRELHVVLAPAASIVAVERHATGLELPPVDDAPAATRHAPLQERRAAWPTRRALVERGDVLGVLADSRFDEATGVLHQSWSKLPVAAVSTEVPEGSGLEWTGRRVARLTGERFRHDRLSGRLDDLVARGAVRSWTLEPRRDEDGSLRLVARVTPDAYDELALGGAFRGDLRWAGFLRLARANLGGRGDALRLQLTGARERTQLELLYRNPGGLGLRTIGFELGGRWQDDEFPLVTEGQRYVDEEAWIRFEAASAWAALVQRPLPGQEFQLGLLHERRRLPDADPTPTPVHERTAAWLTYELDRRDRLLFPTDGGGLRLRVEGSVGGPELWRGELHGDWNQSLDVHRRWTFQARGGLGLSDDADHPSFWFRPGGHRDLYGFVPYGAAAAQYARAGLRLRRQLLERGPFDLHAEVGFDALRTASDSDDLDTAEQRVGYGLSLVARVNWLGPVAVGYARNDDGADVFFVTAGYPFLR